MASTVADTTENGSSPAPESDPHTETTDATLTTTTVAATATATVATTESEPVKDDPPLSESAAEETEATPASDSAGAGEKWPGWPGACVFRVIVPVVKVGGIIGRKGELIKKMSEETGARIRVLDAPNGTSDRIVLISGKEELEAPLSPAMDATIRVFKRVNGLSDSDTSGAAGIAFCSMRLLVPAVQAIHLIGRQGSTIKSIQESSNASIRVLSNEDLPLYVSSEERIVELQGETLNVLKALEAVVAQLRKFLVDQSVIPLYEKMYNTTVLQDRQVEPWADRPLSRHTSQTAIGTDYPLSAKRDSLFLDRETQLESRMPPSGRSLYGEDSALSGIRSSGLGFSGGAIITQIVQTMQIPLAYAEDIIGINGANIAYIRRTSGAILTVQESRALPDEITVEIKGTSSQVQTAQQLIQEFLSSSQEAAADSYGRMDTGFRSPYSQFDNSRSYSSSAHPYGGGYGLSGGGGYSDYRF